MDVMYFLAGLILFLTCLYYYFSRKHHYWQEKNIPCATNIWPLIGNTSLFNFTRKFGDCCAKIYKNHPKNSMVGFYNYSVPCLLIRDPELIKSVLITNFASFALNDLVLDENEEPLLARNPFFTCGTAWKTGRSRLTSNLTGNKLKSHLQIINGTMNTFLNYVNEKCKDNKIYEVEGKELFSKVTGEVAATVGFGIEGNCFDDSKEKENFVAYGKMFFQVDFISKIKMTILLHIPVLFTLFPAPFVPKKFKNIFKQLVNNSIENRQHQVRSLVEMVIEQEEKEGNPKTKERNVGSYMLSFFLDFYESLSCVMTFISYFIAIHKKVQTKVREEVLNIIKKHGELNYEVFGELDYLEQVILETLRLIPVGSTHIKKCTQKIELVGPDGLCYIVQPEEKVYISVDGLHKDPEIWGDPEVFRPERFSKENKGERNKKVFLPFGEGPRMCPGQQIAMVTIKMTFATLLRHYEINLSEKMKLPVELDKFALLPYARGGVQLKLKKVK